ncbi:putative alpha-1,2-mannosidase [Sphingobacterium allocomposti]|uniref:Putative alpha-1,2-mannosidase n=1 Tax=Sphingobacterium allocomposti TaxID=415956 RepID=A0A5S5DLN3_9SPHI|nr:glycoside hydrolase domain-containing protein [Sphingobacterium composti Yoo et al. 2007 non Ten et al. 2007]TYP96837.1 putative alpha-1,2-mannosidase [Sphingobacterium composti Yoo et al. 2007 non Ten et al. 2007]
MRQLFSFFFAICFHVGMAQTIPVNVFLGSSGDHGQLSPAASSPFHQLSILPFTNPGTHTGYEYLAKEIKGFTHNRFEGVGCMGSGGLILVQPFLGEYVADRPLHKVREEASPGFYEVETAEGITVRIATDRDFGRERFDYPKGTKGLFIDLAHAFNGAFVSNTFIREGNRLLGTLRAKTTCHVGIYTIYYAMEIPAAQAWHTVDNKLWVTLPEQETSADLNITFSSVDVADAEAKLESGRSRDFDAIRKLSEEHWRRVLGTVKVKGDKELTGLFYSLLYRVFQSPYLISAADGRFQGTDGEQHRSDERRYHGWAIWDNYKTQLPLLELLLPDMYQGVTSSIVDLYRYGKYDFAGPWEPANSVRTEHAAVVLLDAQRKGYSVPVDEIRDSLVRDTARFDFSKPDKYLEACYDMWALSKLLPEQASHYRSRAESYKYVWNKEFKDLSRRDVDRMSARDMYQGTVRQYRWSVPFDVVGLRELMGGPSSFTEQIDEFYDGYYFNRANEPDMQSFTLYYASDKPWRYQEWVRRIAQDTTIQYYFNDNSRGIGAHIDRIYKNEPKAFVRTMDDDAGAMSAWWVLSALGLHQPLVGEPVFYLSVPFFDEIVLVNGEKPLTITVSDPGNRYIKTVRWNGKDLGRVWMTHEELRRGGHLFIETAEKPTEYGLTDIWVSDLKK